MRRLIAALTLLLALVQFAVPAPSAAGRMHLHHAALGGTPVLYDQRFGTSTDANGLFTFAANAGTRSVWMDATGGNDNNTCLSFAQACQTWDRAFAVFIGAGFTGGDHLMVGAPGTYVDHAASGSWSAKGSNSATYPTAVLSYDRTDAANTTKYGKLVGLNQPVVQIATTTWSLGLNGFFTPRSGYAIQGIYFDASVMSPSPISRSIGGVNRIDNIAIQNNHFKYIMLGFDNGGFSNGSATTLNISKNAFLAPYASNYNTQCLYSNGNNNLYAQDNVFIHCGWELYHSRDDDQTVGGAGTFAHSIYYHAGQTGGRFDRNVSMDAAVDALGVRGSAAITDALTIDESIVGNMTAYSAAWNPNGALEQPGGAIATLDDAVFVGGADISTINPRGAGISSINAQPTGSYANNVVAFDNSRFGQTASQNYFYSITENGTPPEQNQGFALSHIRLHNYATYAFSIAAIAPATLSQMTVTWNDVLVDSLNIVSGGTITGTGVRAWVPGDYPNAITEAQFFSQMGFASKADGANKMWTRPDLHWASAAQGIALPAFGLTPIYTAAAVPSTSGVTLETAYPTALSNLTLASNSFTVGTPAKVYFSGMSANFTLTSTDTPGYTAGQTISALTYGSTTGLPISSITFSGTTATVTTTVAHGMATGDVVTVTGAAPSAYNVSFVTATVLSPTTFSYTMSSTPATNATTVGSYVFSYRVQITTSSPHGLSTGQSITLTGASPSLFNIAGGKITVNSPTSFFFTAMAYPGVIGSATTVGSYAVTPFWVWASTLNYDGNTVTTGTPTFHVIETNTDGIATPTHSTPLTITISP